MTTADLASARPRRLARRAASLLAVAALALAIIGPHASTSFAAKRGGMRAGVSPATADGCRTASSGAFLAFDGHGQPLGEGLVSARLPAGADPAGGDPRAADRNLAADEPSPSPTSTPTPSPSPTPSPTPRPTPSPTPRPTPRPTPWPTPPGITGLDVSHWNDYPDFDRLYAAGMRFVFSKATQGTAMTDWTFKRHTQEARAAGLVAGAYHFFDYTRDGTRQAQHFLSYVRSQTGLDGLLPLVVDVECLRSIGSADHSAARGRLHALLDELYRQTGRYPMIYTSRHMWQQVLGAPTGFGGYPLWVACWKCDTLWLPAGWGDWLFWQVGQYRFRDIGGLDGNVFRSTRMAVLRALRPRDMLVEGGDEYALARASEADLRGVDGAQVRVGIGDGAFGPWEPYAGAFPFQLADAEGPQDVRVQLRSFRGTRSPVFRDGVILDSVPPDITHLGVSLASGERVRQDGSRVPAAARMSASDATSGIRWSALSASCGGRQRASATGTAGSADLAVDLDLRGCDLSARARDVAGHREQRRLEDLVVTLVDARPSKRVDVSGSWRLRSDRTALRRTILKSSAAGARVRYPFDGAQVAVVARKGPTGGRADVLIDGEKVATIDLYAPEPDARRVVHVANVRRGRHVLVVRVQGTGRAASEGTSVSLDGFLVLDRRR